jgi:hypothetical protein
LLDFLRWTSVAGVAQLSPTRPAIFACIRFVGYFFGRIEAQDSARKKFVAAAVLCPRW